MSRVVALSLLSLANLFSGALWAAPPDASAEAVAAKEAPPGPGNVNTATLGGVQFWADELVFHEWRIQRNVYSGHCRLLDDHDVRRAWGKFSHCQDVLEELKRVEELPPLSKKVVITLHGLIRTRGSMKPLGDYLAEHGDCEVLNVGYPSTRADLATHAASLAHVMEHLDGVEEISFVAHSLGNLVIRRYLSDRTDPSADKQPDPRIKRIVMLGPPNNGSQFAVAFKDNPLLGLIWGKSTKQLAADWQNTAKTLAVPQCEFGIIAGGVGINPLVPGNDDLVVGVEETRLAGARDFYLAPVVHTTLMTDQRVHECTLRFLERGCFVSEEARQPIADKTASRARTP